MSLSDIVNDFEKDQTITSEQIASGMMNKENLPLKTEIPFSTDVEITAMLKDACYLVGDMFQDIKIASFTLTDGKLVKEMKTPMFKIKTAKGESLDIPFEEMITMRLLMQVGYSEEYAVSHRRKGRTEMAGILGRRLEMTRRPTDTLTRVMNK